MFLLLTEPLLYAKLDDLCFFDDLEWSVESLVLFLFLLAKSFSSSRGSCSWRDLLKYANAWPTEGTSLVVAPDAFSTIVENMFKKLWWKFQLNILQFSDLGSKARDSGNNLVTLEVSSFSSVGKQLAKSYEVKSLDSLGLKDVTRSSVNFPSETEVNAPEPLTLVSELI
ncbi:hypothetical protein Tco_0265107 [Tanacetum coccineum]